jgi:hypothetical protein
LVNDFQPDPFGRHAAEPGLCVAADKNSIMITDESRDLHSLPSDAGQI